MRGNELPRRATKREQRILDGAGTPVRGTMNNATRGRIVGTEINCASDISSAVQAGPELLEAWRARGYRAHRKRNTISRGPNCHAGSLKPGASRRRCACYREESSHMLSISLAVGLASPIKDWRR
jgi:hypothetical protein